MRGREGYSYKHDVKQSSVKQNNRNMKKYSNVQSIDDHNWIK